VEKSINEKITEFQDRTSWKIDINENANINAASEVIKKLIGEDNIKKVSFYGGKNAVTVF
jgi:cell division protein FtsX